MTRSHFATSALVLMATLLGLTLTLPLTASVATETHSPSDSHAPSPLGLRLPKGEYDGRKDRLPQREGAEEEDELFGDMDPKTLAAVLLEAMNKPHGERRNGGVEDGRKEKERGGEENEGERQEEQEEDEKGEEVRAASDEEGADRERDGRDELELVMAAAAAQGKEERERDEEDERKREQEEEERLTEKVTSRTTSQTIPVKEKRPPAEGERGKEVGAREDTQQGPPTSQETQQEEEEEQLSPDEVQNLQSMLEELQNYNTANKRERDSQAQEQRERESRGYNQDDTDQALILNQIKPKAKGYPLAMSKKLKWQEEMHKALNMPTYRGGNFMDDFDNNLARPAAEEEDDEDEDDEEMLSPEEEERRAKEEQEEVRRQAAEAQRAKAEEEKLADIASDMLLQYMIKQNKGKYQNQKTLLSNAAEDKRSDEEEVNEDDDIDPGTIDKLIEISSKLHLPADDVVDIISDVEKKKKKKDAPETLPWQRPQQRPLVYPAAKAIDAEPSPPRYPTLKQPLLAINPLKAWFKDKSFIKPSKQDQNLWNKPQQKSFRTSSNYPTYPFYQQKPYRGYYPIYYTPPKPKSRYYAKPSFTLNDLVSNSLDYDFDFPPKRRYRPWVQPRPRKPPAALRRNLYYPNYSNYLLPPHPRTYNPLPVPMPKPRSSPPRSQAQPRHRHGYYYQAPSAPLVTRDQDYYGMQGIRMGPQQQDSDEDLENYIQQVFMKPRPRMFQ